MHVTFDLHPALVLFFFFQSRHFWNEEHVSGEGKWIHGRLNVLPLNSCMLYIVMSQNKKTKHYPHPYRNSFVDYIALEIEETVYGQSGLLVTIPTKTTLDPYPKIQIKILSRKSNWKS